MTRLLEDFAQVSCDWFWEMDEKLRFTYFSSRWEEVFGFSPQREIGRSRLEIAVNADNRELWQPHLEDLLARRPFRDLTYPYRHQNGSTVWLRVSGQPIFGPDDAFEGYRGVGTNVTAEIEAAEKLANALADLKNANATLEMQNLLFDAALNNMLHGLCMWDRDLRVIVCNRQYLEIYGFSPAVVRPDACLRDVTRHSFELGNHPDFRSFDELYSSVLTELSAGEASTVERQLRGDRTVCASYRSMADGRWIATYEEITRRKRAEAQISHMAHHDALTNLPNRTLFRSNLQRDLGRLAEGAQLAVLCIDLDGFKGVNDTWGHPVGDVLLRSVTERLLKCNDETDTVARLGGDEFVVIRNSLRHGDEAAGLANLLVQSISEPYQIDGHELLIGASVGVALAPQHGIQPDELLKRADLALYRAKDDGRGVWRFFQPSMEVEQNIRQYMELELNRALQENQFELFYQPVINTVTGRVCSCEALLRWNHPERGIVLPDEFIGVAEEAGLIVPMGEWVLRQACKEAMKWPDHVGVSVNVSPAQFRRADLLQTVIQALAISGLAPNRLELEITETVLLDNNENQLSTLHRLRSLGVRVALDDFGIGYSSFDYLRKYPFNKIKIDRSFLKEFATHQRECAAIIRAIAGMGNGLGMITTAEGVETSEQFRLVRDEGCAEVQGFLFGRPVPAAEVNLFLGAESASQTVG